MTRTITQGQFDAITAYLETHVLPSGMGTEEGACSIAAINLAMTGKLTDDIPDCMSRVIGRWIIRTQDAMPHEMRNSAEWKRLLPLAAGTGRDLEKKRADVVLAWMWDVVLPQLQPIADAKGFGNQWRRMTTKKTKEAALEAKKAASAYASASASAYAAAYASADADAYAYAAAAAAAYAYAAASADAYAYAAFWAKVNPCAVLAAMIEVQP